LHETAKKYLANLANLVYPSCVDSTLNHKYKMTDSNTLTRKQIAKILSRHDGAKAEVSRRANVVPSLISKWLVGMAVSANVAAHAEAYARELLAREEADRIAKSEANGPSARKIIDAIKTGDPAVEPIIEKLTKSAHQEE
jgi:hypothetical protein